MSEFQSHFSFNPESSNPFESLNHPSHPEEETSEESSEAAFIDKIKISIFAQALKNQNTGITLKSFLDNQVKKEIDSINLALDQMNLKELKFMFHHLLSTSAALGLLKLAELCRKAEESCSLQDPSALTKFTHEINQEFNKILHLPLDDEHFLNIN